MRIGIYVRVSTDEQAKDGFSIEAQRRILNAWAVVKGASDIIEYVDDGYSAKNLNRPGVQNLIQDCRAHKLDAVLVWRLDRLTRNLRDLLMLMEDVFRANGVEFVSSTESIDTSTPTGRLMLNVLGAFAQNEREVNAQRVKAVMMEISKGCKHLGGIPPYGYSVDSEGYYQIQPEEAEAVRMIFTMKSNGASYSEIADALARAGHVTRSGAPFGKNTLYDMLRNEKYTGVYLYNRAAEADRNGRRNNRASKPESEITRIDGGMPAIISIDEWKKVRNLSKEGTALGGKNHAKNNYILSGLVYCGECGRKMVICNGGKNRDGSYWRAYRCPGKCVPGVEYRKLEECVFDFLELLASDKGTIERVLNTVEEFNLYAAQDSKFDLDSMRAALAQAQRERDNLFKLASMSDDPPRSLLDEIRKREAEIEIQRQKTESAERSVLCISKKEVLERFSMIAGIRKLDKDQQKMVVKAIIEAITIYADRIDITITTNSHGGADEVRAALVKVLTFTITPALLKQHKFPKRFLE